MSEWELEAAVSRRGSMMVNLCRLAVTAAAVCSWGCTDFNLICSSIADCDEGMACHESTCRQICIDHDECDRAESCQSGVCLLGSRTECDSDFDCDDVGPCRPQSGARCLGGRCEYNPVPLDDPCDDGNACTPATTCDIRGECVGATTLCDQAPASECVNGDTTYRSYAGTGICDADTGDCSYPFTDFDCPNCAVACLAACAGVTCDEHQGGCQSAGTCVPESPPRCNYTVAGDGTLCDLPGDTPGTLRGVCSGGTCEECETGEDCFEHPGLPACFPAACTGGVCSYAIEPTAECQPSSCAGATQTNARVCGPAGDCLDTGSSSCGNYQCDSGGVACLTSCTGNGDCVAPAECMGTTCSTGPNTLPLGASCMMGPECDSGHCVDGVCCENACSGACAACGSDGLCDDMPADDPLCATVDCDPNDTACRDYHDLTADLCKAFGTCKDSGDCNDFTNAGSGDQPSGCNVCEECDGNGNCGDVPNGQGRPGCNAGGTTCSGADSCNGSGGCNANHLSSGAQPGGCDGCRQCDGSGGCGNVPGGQSRPGCNAGATNCSGADTCDGGGGCDDNDFSSSTSCGTCRRCNGSGSCNNTPNGQSGPGCNGSCEECQGGGCNDTSVTCYRDADGDGYSSGSTGTQCGGCGSGWLSSNTMWDCNDSKRDMHPNAPYSSSPRDCNGQWDCDCVTGIQRNPNFVYDSCDPVGGCGPCVGSTSNGCGDSGYDDCSDTFCDNCDSGSWVTIGCR